MQYIFAIKNTFIKNPVLTTLAGQTFTTPKGQDTEIIEGIEITPSKGFEKEFRKILKLAPDGSILATGSFEVKRGLFLSHYRCSDLKPLHELPTEVRERLEQYMLGRINSITLR